MEKIYIIIESCYHAAYLINQLSDILSNNNPRFSLVIRNKKKLNAHTLTMIHQKLCIKKQLTANDLSELNDAYGGLSQSELALIEMYGVPPSHVLTFFIEYLHENLNSGIIEESLRQESLHKRLSAIIFLDCILAPWWLEVFESRIVNGHSAVLPYARGMYAIEQVAATGDSEAFIRAAGATIHYIDRGVDTGPLITRKALNNIWRYESIWQIKAASYLLAFSLLSDYIRKEHAFMHTDILKHEDILGPEYKARDFSDNARRRAEENYKKYRLIYHNYPSETY